MKIELSSSDNGTYIVFSGPMTCQHSREIENSIIDAMRRHRRLNVDLSEVKEVDLCGIHLLRVLKSFGGDAVRIVATSPSIDYALLHLPNTKRPMRHEAPMTRPMAHPSPGINAC